MDTYEDLKAFEQRLTEVVAGHRPSMLRRRKLLPVLIFAAGMFWYMFPIQMSLWIQIVFTVVTIIIVLIIFREHHKPELAPEQIAAQARSVLENFNMSCDDAGRLILKAPRSRPPNTPESLY